VIGIKRFRKAMRHVAAMESDFAPFALFRRANGLGTGTARLGPLA